MLHSSINTVTGNCFHGVPTFQICTRSKTSSFSKADPCKMIGYNNCHLSLSSYMINKTDNKESSNIVSYLTIFMPRQQFLKYLIITCKQVNVNWNIHTMTGHVKDIISNLTNTSTCNFVGINFLFVIPKRKDRIAFTLVQRFISSFRI